MKPFSSTIARLGTETAFKVAPEIAKLEREGWDIVKLTIGEPSGNIPACSTAAAKASLDRHETHYVVSQGILELREAIANYMSATRNIDYNADDIVLTPGGKTIICGAMMTCIESGDEVLIPSPGYPVYESMVNYVGGKPVLIPILEEKNFSLDVNDLPNLITPKTKMIVINSPANPTGGVLSKSDLKAVADIACDHDLYVLADEIYSRIVFGETFDKVEYKGNKLPIAPSIVSIADMAERTIILDGFSKTYAMTGLRVGFGCTKIPGLIQHLTNIAINYWACIPQPLQMAALAALGEDQQEAIAMCKSYEMNRDIVVPGLNNIRGIRCLRPLGSFYCFPNVTEVCKNLDMPDVEALRKYLLRYDEKRKRGVAILGRHHFGTKRHDETEEYIRISFAGSKSSLIEGMQRLQEAIEI
jgi:aspartate/methionine/tyrosine aminotransferase